MALADRSGQALINAYALYALGTATPTSDQRATSLAELNRAYKKMCRGVYFDEQGRRCHHLFSFLHPTSVDLSVSAQGNASYTHQDLVFTAVDEGSDGEDVTVTIAAGSGALAVAESDDDITITLAVDGNTTAEVQAACSALTVATVTGGSATAATALAETHLELAVAATALASGFNGIVESVRFKYDGQDSYAYQDIELISPEAMDEKLRDWSGERGDPQYVCIRPKALSVTTGTVYEAVLFPPPEDAVTLAIRHRPTAAALTDSASAYAVGNDGIEELILTLAYAEYERKGGQVQGPEWKNAQSIFADCVEEDSRLFPVETVPESYAGKSSGIDI